MYVVRKASNDKFRSSSIKLEINFPTFFLFKKANPTRRGIYSRRERDRRERHSIMILWDFIIAVHKFWARAKAICAGGDPNNRAAIRSPGRVSRNPN